METPLSKYPGFGRHDEVAADNVRKLAESHVIQEVAVDDEQVSHE